MKVSIAIPTYRREEVLVQTVRDLLALEQPADEIVLVDQTSDHETATEQALASWADQGLIRWIRLKPPSITSAMNRALIETRGDIVLFVDDDVRPEPCLVGAHLQAHADHPGSIVAGRVIQPWQEGVVFGSDEHVHLAGVRSGWIGEFIGCNFSVARMQAISLGGFDENFVKVAFRYEAEFAHRHHRLTGDRIWFQANACLHHLKETAGGTRAWGDHLRTAGPEHAVGAYYHAFRTGLWREAAWRPLRAVRTRFHLSHPWRIPLTWLAEARGFLLAARLHMAGPRLLQAVPPINSHG